MFWPTRDGHQHTQYRMSRFRNNHQLASLQSTRAVLVCGLHLGALSSVQNVSGADFVVFFALSLSACFYCGAVRRSRPGKVVSMYMKSLAVSQKSKLSIGEELAVGTEIEAPALEHGRIVSCHSPVAQIKKRGATARLHVPASLFASCEPAF